MATETILTFFDLQIQTGRKSRTAEKEKRHQQQFIRRRRSANADVKIKIPDSFLNREFFMPLSFINEYAFPHDKKTSPMANFPRDGSLNFSQNHHTLQILPV